MKRIPRNVITPWRDTALCHSVCHRIRSDQRRLVSQAESQFEELQAARQRAEKDAMAFRQEVERYLVETQVAD